MAPRQRRWAPWEVALLGAGVGVTLAVWSRRRDIARAAAAVGAAAHAAEAGAHALRDVLDTVRGAARGGEEDKRRLAAAVAVAAAAATSGAVAAAAEDPERVASLAAAVARALARGAGDGGAEGSGSAAAIANAVVDAAASEKGREALAHVLSAVAAASVAAYMDRAVRVDTPERVVAALARPGRRDAVQGILATVAEAATRAAVRAANEGGPAVGTPAAPPVAQRARMVPVRAPLKELPVGTNGVPRRSATVPAALSDAAPTAVEQQQQQHTREHQQAREQEDVQREQRAAAARTAGALRDVLQLAASADGRVVLREVCGASAGGAARAALLAVPEAIQPLLALPVAASRRTLRAAIDDPWCSVAVATSVALTAATHLVW